MKVLENVTVYKCEFCKKKLYVKSAMEHHEKYCSRNPANFKACDSCVHLQEIKITYEIGDDYYSGEPNERSVTGFRCKLFDKKMYPTKVERKKLVEKYPWTFQDQISMPKECSGMSNDERDIIYETNVNEFGV